MATKAQMCIVIYGELTAVLIDQKEIRRQFIERAVKEAGCTPQGAATYYANCKNRGGATGEKRGESAAPSGEFAGRPDNLPEDTRPLYSAIQRNTQGKVARCSTFMDAASATARAAKVRGLAVYGAPEIGDDASTLKVIAS